MNEIECFSAGDCVAMAAQFRKFGYRVLVRLEMGYWTIVINGREK